MSNGKNTRGKRLAIRIIAIILFVAMVYILECDPFGLFSENNESPPIQLITEEENDQTTNINVEGNLILTMIDVGQADSFLFVQNGETALIDCGTRSTGKDVVKYLQEQGITRLDYVFGTHPHDDHMGGMYDVITNFEVGTLVIPQVTKNSITSSWYANLLTEIASHKYNVDYPEVGEVYKIGDATMTVLGPLEEPEDNLNNYSTVLMVSFGEMDVLMTGDMESDFENKILEKGTDVDAEILKVGHHGSDTSTGKNFLAAVMPDYALISSKVGNRYNHPVKSTMDMLKEEGIPVYRTDESGTVVVTITSDTVTFNTEPDDYLSGPELEERTKK